MARCLQLCDAGDCRATGLMLIAHMGEVHGKAVDIWALGGFMKSGLLNYAESDQE
jgi:hypothetical protein